MTLKKKPLENKLGKGENTDNHQFLHVPQSFLSIPNEFLCLTFICIVVCKCFQMLQIIDQSKNLLFGKDLIN